MPLAASLDEPSEDHTKWTSQTQQANIILLLRHKPVCPTPSETNHTNQYSLEQRKVYYRFIQGDGRRMP